ncbi:MAG: twin-arginine translocase subunit TatC [Bdellovibrionales bacterium]|nr:twin-arginine translocase subunit TatC [Bdellovibrionales bacterium]
MKKIDPRMSFFEHLRELRGCVFRSFIGLLLGFAVAYFFSKEIFQILRVPFDQAYFNVYGSSPFLIVKSVLESFVVYLKVGLLGGVFISSPYLFAQLWIFISPALKSNEKKHVLPFVILATLFFVSGAFFGYFLVFPKSFEFFLGITKNQHIEIMIGMQEYYKFASWMLLGFGLIFEAPLIVIYFIAFGIISTEQITQHWRGVIVGILVASAVITPTPDFATMLMMSAPLFGFYILIIILSKTGIFNKTKSKESV